MNHSTNGVHSINAKCQSATNATSATNAKCQSAESLLEIADAPGIPDEVYQNLPQRLDNLTSLIDTRHGRDVFLLACLPILSSQMPNVLAAHKDKLYSPDVLVQIIAGPGMGKGHASKALPLSFKTDTHIREQSKLEIQQYELKSDEEKLEIDRPKQQSLLIPANASSRMMLDRIEANKGSGLIFESEIDTLTGATKQEWGNYTDTVRKAFQHEPLSIIRTNGEYYIKNPRLSICLTGTFDQFKAMFDSAENGHFSRYALYTFDAERKWQSHRPTKKSRTLTKSVEASSKELFEMYQRLKRRNEPLHIELENHQWDILDQTFEEKMLLIDDIGLSDHLHASNFRMPIIALRLIMIFTVLRANDTDIHQLIMKERLTPTDEDIKAALLLAENFIDHAIRLYHILPNSDNSNNAKGKRYQKFLGMLPKKFETADALLVAEELGISERTAKRWLNNDDDMERIKRGHYQKKTKVSDINWGF